MRSKSNDLYFKTADQHFPLVFPTIVRVFKVEVTVSKNALKLRLFTIGTPFLTLGLSVEQAAPGERNVSAGKARQGWQDTGQQSANAFIRQQQQDSADMYQQSMKCSFSASGPFSDTL